MKETAAQKAHRTMKENKLKFTPFFIKGYQEHIPKEKVTQIQKGLQGIYILTKKVNSHFNVVYVGKSEAKEGMRKRLKDHLKTKESWTHFSLVVLHENINFNMLSELEGLLLMVYRLDESANNINKIKLTSGFSELKKIYVN